MTLNEYRKYYIDFIVTILGPAVKREANCDLGLQIDLPRRDDYENKMNGLSNLILVSFIEANFLTKSDLQLLRKFRAPSCSLPTKVNPVEISGFIYIRDCFAHDPTGSLLKPGDNTAGFLHAVSSGAFPWANVSAQSIHINPLGTHQLHLNVLRFFGEPV